MNAEGGKKNSPKPHMHNTSFWIYRLLQDTEGG